MTSLSTYQSQLKTRVFNRTFIDRCSTIPASRADSTSRSKAGLSTNVETQHITYTIITDVIGFDLNTEFSDYSDYSAYLFIVNSQNKLLRYITQERLYSIKNESNQPFPQSA